MKRNLFLLTAVILLSTVNLFSQLSLEVVWEKQQGGVIDAKFSPDGKFVYCAVGKTIKKLDVETGEFIATFDNSLSPFIYKVHKMDISKDGKWLVTSNAAGAIDIWDTQQNKLVKEPGFSGFVAAFYNNTTLLIASNRTAQGIYRYDFVNDRNLDSALFPFYITHLQMSADGNYFITGSVYKDWQGKGFCKVTLWDAATLKPIRDYEVPEGNYDGFRKIQLSDNNKLIGFATHVTNKVKILETETGKVVKTSDVGMSGYDFELLPNSYYLIYQENESNINEYGFQIFKYPDIFQSNLKRLASGVIISNITEDDKISIFCISQGMTLLRSTTTSVANNPTEQFIFKVESDKIIVSFKNAESFKIIDMHGNIVLEKSVNQPAFSIPNTFSSGTYICVIKSGSQEYSQKFQVVR